MGKSKLDKHKSVKIIVFKDGFLKGQERCFQFKMLALNVERQKVPEKKFAGILL